MNIEKLKFYPVKTVEKLASFHLRLFIDRVFFKGKDKDNNSFGGYKSEQYVDMKSRGFVKKRGRGRYKGYVEQPIESTQTGKVDLKATGKLWKATHAYDEDTNSYRIGWDENRDKKFKTENVQIVQGQKKQGRDILGVPDSEMEKVVNQLGNFTEKLINKIVKNVNIRVG